MSDDSPVLKVRDLTVDFSMYDRGWKKRELEVLHSLDVEVGRGEIVAVAGSSGSGKSVLAHCIMGMLPENASARGSVLYMGEELSGIRARLLKNGDITFIPQSVDFLDPLMKAGEQIKGVRGSEEKTADVMRRCGLEKDVKDKYPFQLSGGMARRVLIASALSGEPKLIIADEPTPGLEASLAEEMLKGFRRIADTGCAVLLITHDIDTAVRVADRVAVFYAGTTVEVCPASDFVSGRDALRHPYTKALVDAMPQNDFTAIEGRQPYAGALPEGCLFGDRCSLRTEECRGYMEMRDLRGGKVRCLHAT